MCWIYSREPARLGWKPPVAVPSSVMFVENARGSIECLERNRTTFQQKPWEVTCEFSLARVAVEAQLRKLATSSETFSLIFADPPYGSDAQDLLRNNFLPQLLSADGLLVLESAKRDALVVTKPWESVRSAIYGDTRVDFWRREPGFNEQPQLKISPPIPRSACSRRAEDIFQPS